MIIYNETVKIDLNVHDLWLKWMKEEHVQRVMETGCFTGYKIYRILAEDETDGITYAFQYFAGGMGDYFNYNQNHASRLQKQGLDMFPDKYMMWSTVLREV